MRQYPKITVEIFENQGFVDIIIERYNAGVRLHESLEKNMVSVKISNELRLITVAAAKYLKNRSIPFPS